MKLSELNLIEKIAYVICLIYISMAMVVVSVVAIFILICERIAVLICNIIKYFGGKIR